MHLKPAFRKVLLTVAVPLVLVAVYLFLLPGFTYAVSAAEAEIGSFAKEMLLLRGQLLLRGYSLRVLRISPEIMEDSWNFASYLGGVGGKLLFLSPVTTYYANLSDFYSLPGGPFTIAVSAQDAEHRYDAFFTYSETAGWNLAAEELKEKKVVAVATETVPMYAFETVVESNPESKRQAQRTNELAKASGAEIVCVPYVADFSMFMYYCEDVKFVVDYTLVPVASKLRMYGYLSPDIFESVKPLLDAGVKKGGELEGLDMQLCMHLVRRTAWLKNLLS